jgi:aminoglycoside phosphotransferase family enzyme
MLMLVKNHPFDSAPAPVEPLFADKVKFLRRGDAYCPPVAEVTCHETHMSQVFLAGDRVYKLKKPVRFPYLDFFTLAKREKACRPKSS